MSDEEWAGGQSLDGKRSTLVVRTRTKGLFSAVAHDLEIAADDMAGSVAASRGELRVVMRGLRVVGALKHGRVDTNVLSENDRTEITRKMRDEVFRGQAEIKIVAEGAPPQTRVRVTFGAKVADARVHVSSRQEGADLVVIAKGELKMTDLGLVPPKGPLNAFSVADAVEIEAKLVFGG